jgi:hypothetical protein
MLQFGDKTGGSGHCAQCEAMLTDALDGTLSAADQEQFDTHLAACDPCSQLLADARRGFAFLELLRHPAPEPPAALLERILAQTNAQPIAHPSFQADAGMQPAGVPGVAVAQPIALPAYANVVPFRRRFTTAVRGNSLGQLLLQPRLAMTAAMAFFSIALTMNLTGIRLRDLRASDLSPGSLKRDFVSVRTRGVQYYEGLRVVYVLESRVHDLQGASDSDAPGSSQTTSDSVRPGSAKPEGQTPAAEPGKNSPAAQPEQKKQPAARPAPAPGSSRRETTGHTLSLASASGLNRAELNRSGLNRAGLNPYIVANTCFKQVEGTLV